MENNSWISPLGEFDPNDYFGFVYMIVNKESGKFYIGKKQFHNRIKRKPLKGKTRNRITYKESDWKNYWSSSEDLQTQILLEGEDKFDRIILALCKTKIDMSYTEVEVQVTLNVLANSKAFNGAIGTNIYRGSMKENTARDGLNWVDTLFQVNPDILRQSPLVNRLVNVLSSQD